MTLLYIDPGTGSALFSIIIGATAAVYFLLRAAILKLKIVLSGGKPSQGGKNTFVIYAEDKRYWSLFKPVLDEFEDRKTELLYLTSSPDDPVFDGGYTYIKGELLREGNKAYARLNFLSADFLLATTPGLDVYQWKRSKGVGHYAHVLHMVSDATTYRMFGLDYFDSVLMTGSYQGDDIRRIEAVRGLSKKELVTVGCSYLDEFQKKLSLIPQEDTHPFTVLVSPSWGPSALLSLYGEELLDPLVSADFRIIIRPHPQSKISESKILERLTERYKSAGNVIWDYERDNIYSLAKADIMISDFSGIIFDYAFLRDKPVLYVNYELDLRPYDAYFLPGSELWQTKTLREIGVDKLL
ncbi:CDP-glycerol glycerophosphotransferase [Spirochaetia bacterium]|nr:CDP-glycerol glycerophosphotransferase [Spirochaetia bacterium]